MFKDLRPEEAGQEDLGQHQALGEADPVPVGIDGKPAGGSLSAAVPVSEHWLTGKGLNAEGQGSLGVFVLFWNE